MKDISTNSEIVSLTYHIDFSERHDEIRLIEFGRSQKKVEDRKINAAAGSAVNVAAMSCHGAFHRTLHELVALVFQSIVDFG